MAWKHMWCYCSSSRSFVLYNHVNEYDGRVFWARNHGRTQKCWPITRSNKWKQEDYISASNQFCGHMSEMRQIRNMIRNKKTHLLPEQRRNLHFCKVQTQQANWICSHLSKEIINYMVFTRSPRALPTLRKVTHFFHMYVMSDEAAFILDTPLGDAGRTEGHRWIVRHQDPQERHHHPGRWRGMHHGGKEGPGSGPKTSIPGPNAFLLPDHGK